MFLLNTGDCLVTGESDGPEWRRGGWTAGATQLGEHPHGVVVEERPRHVDHEGRGEALVTVGILSSFDMFLPGNKHTWILLPDTPLLLRPYLSCVTPSDICSETGISSS